jgi:hypothetical protein
MEKVNYSSVFLAKRSDLDAKETSKKFISTIFFVLNTNNNDLGLEAQDQV